MPTYEYVCRSCGERTEAVQAFTDAALTTCPTCGGELRKLFGNVGIVFKGSGFYKTDSRSSSSASTTVASPERNGEGASGDKATTGSDAPAKADSSAPAPSTSAPTPDSKASAKPSESKAPAAS